MLLTAAMAIGSLAACSHDDEEFIEPDPDNGSDSIATQTVELDINFDWNDASNATPSGMCVYFYPQGGLANTSFSRFDFASISGGTVKIAPGKYNIICYSNDTEVVQFYGTDNFYSHTAYTREGSIYESIYGDNTITDQVPTVDNQRVTIEPDMMWGCAAKGIEIKAATDSTYNGVVRTATKGDASLNVTLKPHALTHEYSYEIRNAEGITDLAGMSVTISGMAGELNLAHETCGKELVTIPSNATYDGSTIRGSFRTFGKPTIDSFYDDEQATDSTATATPNYIMVYAVKSDGSTLVYGSKSHRIEVTDQLQGGSDDEGGETSTTGKTIVIDGIGPAQPIESVQPEVDDWKQENEEIKI